MKNNLFKYLKTQGDLKVLKVFIKKPEMIYNQKELTKLTGSNPNTIKDSLKRLFQGDLINKVKKQHKGYQYRANEFHPIVREIINFQN